MSENICLMLTESNSATVLIRVLSLAVAAVDLNKRTAIYVGGRWSELSRAGELERHDRELKGIFKGISVVEMFRHFQYAGGQLWISPLSALPPPYIPGATVVDDRTLISFLTQDTVVLNF